MKEFEGVMRNAIVAAQRVKVELPAYVEGLATMKTVLEAEISRATLDAKAYAVKRAAEAELGKDAPEEEEPKKKGEFSMAESAEDFLNGDLG